MVQYIEYQKVSFLYHIRHSLDSGPLCLLFSGWNSLHRHMRGLLSCMHACLAASVVSDSVRPYGLQPARFLCPWDSPRQEYWSGLLPCPPPRDLTNLGIKPVASPASSALQADSLALSHWGSPGLFHQFSTKPSLLRRNLP